MDCKRYDNNPITRVILLIKFPQLLSLSESPPSEFQNAIMETFPYVKVIEGHDVSVNLTQLTDPIIDRKKNVTWEFQSKDRLKKVFVNETSLSFEFRKYTHFDNFKKIVEDIFDKFTKIYQIAVFKIGLRYINEVKEEGTAREWEGLINENLISILSENFLSKEDKLARSMQVLELNEDDYNFIFKFGLFNSDYPSIVTKKEFVLDYDCISKEDLERNDVFNTIDRFHQIIYNWFEKSIEDKLRLKWGCQNGKK